MSGVGKKVHFEFLGNIVWNYSIGRFSIYVNVMVDGQHRMEIKQLMIYKNIKKNLTTHGQNNEISKYTQYPCKPRV